MSKIKANEFVSHPDDDTFVRVVRDGFGKGWIIEATVYASAKTKKKAKRRATRLAKLIKGKGG